MDQAGKDTVGDLVGDLLIRDVAIHDGDATPPVRGDLAVRDGRILAIGDRLSGRFVETVDGRGRALAPGFIDVHTHDDAIALTHGAMAPKLSQGVTCVVTGNCGISLAPGLPDGLAAPVPPLDLLGTAEAFAFPAFADYLAALRSTGPDLHVVPLVGHAVLRLRAMGPDLDRPATAAQIAAMRDDLAAALDAGAVGLSTGLAYPTARYAATDEIVALVGDVARAGRLWTTHMRDERSGVVSAVAETLDIARRTGARVLISHHKCCGEGAFGLSRTTLDMIAAARQDMPVDLDVYPYTASSTVLTEAFARDSRNVTISWSDPHPETEGRDLRDIAADWGVSERDALERLKPGGAIYHQMDEADLRRILAFGPSLVGSDGLPRDRRPHPRLWGSFPRVLGHYARDEALFPLETAIAKMTGRTADVLGLHGRGRLAPGLAADLVLFDPATVADAATYDHPVQPSHGIDRVWVGGRLAWAGGAAQAAGAGRVLSADPP
ncbi:N-acyl-D-amino-acid deacylase family protein, partial [Meridianimarinicoccus zhengii]|uniref:N-acyl-D-amino-acid deacylase family protein n=1 Tax=Meridianimarinicoccus zhengii TaxID=2056810 RepID=UPI000DAC5FFE